MKGVYGDSHLAALRESGRDALNAQSETVLQLIVSGLREGIWNNDPVTRERMIGMAAVLKTPPPALTQHQLKKAL